MNVIRLIRGILDHALWQITHMTADTLEFRTISDQSVDIKQSPKSVKFVSSLSTLVFYTNKLSNQNYRNLQLSVLFCFEWDYGSSKAVILCVISDSITFLLFSKYN